MNKIAFLAGYMSNPGMDKEAGVITDLAKKPVGEAAKEAFGAAKSVFNKVVEPQFTFTSAGGPGFGTRFRKTPFMMDIDPTGPGFGIVTKPETVAKLVRMVPGKRAKALADKVERIPANIYSGVEFAGIVPAPFVGLSGGTAEKEKIIELAKALFNKKKATGV